MSDLPFPDEEIARLEAEVDRLHEALNGLGDRVGNLGGFEKWTIHGNEMYVKRRDVLSQIEEALTALQQEDRHG